MRRNAVTFILIGLFAVPLAAQDRSGGYGGRPQGIPPGQLPPPGACRVWYDNLPPGRQPAPTNCREAERIAARDRNARVVYGVNPQGRDDGRPRAIPRTNPPQYPGRYPSTPGRYNNPVIFDNGYNDGYEKGREDARDNDSYDPVRHARYRDGDHLYNRRYGSRDDYKIVYREGFEAGYDQGYRENRRRNGTFWPF